VTDTKTILGNVQELAAEFAVERSARQRRRTLDPADFARLREAGYPLMAVPVAQGGTWESVARSAWPVCDALRTLAHGDSSVALVSAMHPAVLGFWLATPEAPAPHADAWAAQRREVCQAAHDGAWWGTITSEPGSGGDVAQTRAVARADGADGWRLSGQKHFGSGSGITAYMLTSAVPAGEPEPDWYFLDVRGAPWDGATGMRLVAEWDGHGMTATQSHGFEFTDFPATRFAWPGHWRAIQDAVGGLIGCLFTAVIVGIVETALDAARAQLARRRGTLRPYEQVEWARAELEGWLVQQAFTGMLRAVEEPDPPPGAVVYGKTAVAELAESALGRICRVLGGGVYARHAPFGHWAQDVRALGYLRPPWGLAYDRLLDASWANLREAGA
jgi:alkylation response protein AidB-like acyl-CoA dehydrogenase